MAQRKKDKETRTFRLDTSLIKQLDDYADKSLLNKSVVVELALKQYLDGAAVGKT